jgi:outer membrane protein
MKQRLTRSAIAVAALFSAAASSNAAFGADLIEVYRDALAQDPVYASARSALQAGREATPQARAGVLPNISGGANYSRVERDTSFGNSGSNSYGYSLNLTQPLYRPQNWIVIDQAGFQVKQAEAVFADAQQTLITRTAQAYFDVLLAQDNVALSAAQKKAFSEQLAQAKRNFEVGTATIVDTFEAQARFDLAVSKEIADQSDLEIKRQALTQLVGKNVAVLAALKENVTLSPPTPASMEEWVKTSEGTSPLIAQLMAVNEIAKKEVDRAQAGHQPTLDLVGSYGDTRSPSINALGQSGPTTSTKTAQLSLQLAIPIYQGGGTQSRIRQALANRDKSAQDLENTKRTVAQSARQSFLGVTNGVAQVKALEAALVSSKSSLDSTILGKEVGVRTNVDILNAQQQLFQARRDLQQARYNTILSQLRLKSAVGRLQEEDLAEVNRLLQK